MLRDRNLLPVLLLGLGMAPVGLAQERGPLSWQSPEGDPTYQRPVALIATPWLDKRESGGIVHFLYSDSARIERFDLASGSWLAEIVPLETPTAFWVDADGLYLSFGRRTSRFALDGTGETHLRNTSVDASGLFTIGNTIYISAGDDILSADKSTGSLIDQEEYSYGKQGFSVAPTIGKAFARTNGVWPSDIVEIVLPPDGTLGPQDDSPYHGDYPDASKTYVFPDGMRVADNSGIVYSTADLTYSSSLAGSFDDLDFHGDLPIVLRDGTIYSYSSAFLRTGQHTPAEPSLGIAVHGDSVFSFSMGITGVEATEIPLTTLTKPTPGLPVDPNGLGYEPDALVLGVDEIVYLLSRNNLSIFRWSIARNRYLETIPLIEPPSFMAYSGENHTLYLAYDSGEITAIDLDGAFEQGEAPFVNSPQTPCGLSTAGEYLFVCDPSGAWVSHFTYSPAGVLISQEEWNYYSLEYIWSAANRKMYHFRDDTSPNALVWEEIDISGVLGVQMDSPVHSGEGIIHPIRVAPDGSLVILGSGRLYDAISLVQVDTLSNDIDDAVWADGILYTLRPLAGHSQVQKWDQPNWGVGAARVVDGSPIRLFVARDKLLVVTLQDGKPRFTISNLDLAMIFANGFESGDTSAWSATGGAFARFFTAHGGAAANGAFGAEAMVGASCTAEENLLITPPPAIVQGTFFACSTVAAEAVEVGAAGATFAAGHSVSLGSAFSVPEGGVFTAAIDTATLSGLAYVEDDSPDRIGCYNTRLSLNIDGLTLASGDRIDHLVGYSSDGEVQFQVALLWNVALGENRLALTVRRDNGTFATTLGGEELIAPAGWMTLELAWRTGSGDGYFLASVNGDPFVGLDGLDNDLQTLDQIRWGNVGGVVTTSAGSLLLDDFESWE